jgi:formylglycine-generating enzyme required for sulfatase activity
LPAPDDAPFGLSKRASATPTTSALVSANDVVFRLRSAESSMVKIRGGMFHMGSTEAETIEATLMGAREHMDRTDASRFANELPQHIVFLSAYWLDRFEVTVAAYEHCVRLRRCEPVPYAEGAARFRRPRLPASLVRWGDAFDYCRFVGKRLPTEAEFERAARGLTGRRYPWGNLFNSHVANHGRRGLSQTDDRDGFPELATVGSFPSGRTPDGIADLSGNVAEWVLDRYAAPYPRGPVTDPQGPAGPTPTNSRVFRGGHYMSAAPFVRAAARDHAEPDTRSPTLGFRCSRSAVLRKPPERATP